MAERRSLKPSDSELVERVKAGDEAAFEALLERYQDRVYRLARGLTRDPRDAEEVVQEVFLTIYRKIHSFEGRAAFSTWLYRITMNVTLMMLRGRGPEDPGVVEALLPSFTAEGRHAQMVHDWTKTPEEHLLQQEVREAVRRGIATLPAEYQAVLVLRDLEGLSNGEVAEVLGLTVLAVKARLHRARLALRALLERLFQEERGKPGAAPTR